MVYGASAVPVVIEYIHVYNIPVFWQTTRDRQ